MAKQSAQVGAPFDQWLALGIACLLTATCGYLVFGHGQPMLRHDWRFPDFRAAVGPYLSGYFSGWLQSGIGRPQPYPTFYYVGFLLWPVHSVLPPAGVPLMIVTSAVFLLSMAGSNIARSRGGTAIHQAGVACFLCLNPWTYSKLVAGHVVMVLALAFLAMLISELLQPIARRWVVISLSALLVTQIQFLVVAIVPVTIALYKARQRSAIVAVAVSTVPIAVGILSSLDALQTIPYNLQWQEAQSVPPLSAVILRGYQFGYDAAFFHWNVALAICAATAAAGAWIHRRERHVQSVFVSTFFCLILAEGTRGPIAPVYSAAVTHFRPSAVFRELYDLIGLVALGYAVLAATAIAGTRFRGWIFLAASISLVVPWIAHPPFDWFVSARVLPQGIKMASCAR